MGPRDRDAVMNAQEELIDLMRRAGIPITRENYIAAAWGNPLPEWTAELEFELPEELQDWSLFEVQGDKLALRDATVLREDEAFEAKHPRGEKGRFGDKGDDAGARTPDLSEDPPEGFVRVYRGINPERNKIASDDPTHGAWFVTSWEEAVSYANWDYKGTGELGPDRAVVAVDIPEDLALKFTRGGGSRVRIDSVDELYDTDHPVEMLVDRDTALKAILHDGEHEHAAPGMPKGWK